MFEPRTYSERRARLTEITMHQMLALFAPILGEEGNNLIRSYNETEQHLRRDHSIAILGKPSLNGEVAVDRDFLTGLAKANLGRTFFNAKVAGTQIENAIGTKGFGKKYKAWVEELPSVSQVLSTRSYPAVAAYEAMDPNRGPVRLPVFIVPNISDIENAEVGFEEVHLISLSASEASIVSLSMTHLPEGFSFANENAFQQETYTYRGGLTRAEFAAGFAAALNSQYDTPRPFILPAALFATPELYGQAVAAIANTPVDTVLDVDLTLVSAPPSEDEVKEHLAEVEADEAELREVFEKNLAEQESAQADEEIDQDTVDGMFAALAGQTGGDEYAAGSTD